MSKTILKPIMLFLILQGSLAHSQTAGEAAHVGEETEESIRQVEHHRLQAMIHLNFAALDSILAEELTYTHTNGRVDGKSQLLSAMRSGSLRYESIEFVEAQIRIYGAAAVVTGTASMKVKTGNQQLSFQARFTDVYVKQNSLWKMIAWQSTRIPEQ